MQTNLYMGLTRGRLPVVSAGGVAMAHLQAASSTIEPAGDGGRLSALPVLMNYLRRLRVRELIDEAAPKHELHFVSHGECIEAMLCSIFTGTHTLSKIEHVLSGFDLDYLFGHTGLRSEHFNDTRLGEALDALYGKTDRLQSAIVFAGLGEFGIKVRRVQLDSTTVSVYGDYDSILEVEASLIKRPPIPAFGFSKDHRPDLKQMLISMSMCDVGVPLYGRVQDGNVSDIEEFRHHLEKLAGMLESLRDIVLVADCKLCTDPTLAMAYELGFNIVTLMPETYALRSKLIELASQESDLPVLMTTKDGAVYRGKSFKIPVTIEKSDGQKETVFWRYVVVHSSQLEEQKLATRKREVAAERRMLDRELTKLIKTPFACQPDAEKAAHEFVATCKAAYHRIDFTTEAQQIPVTAGRGRRKAEPPSPVTKYFLSDTISEILRPERKYAPEGMFVLLTTISDRRELRDSQVLEAYKGQQVVEMGFHWLKGPLAIAPVFLKLPSRIDVLGFVYLISMFLYGLVQRDLRARLAERGGKVMHAGGQRTDRPTTRGVFELFEWIERIVYHDGLQSRAAIRYINANIMEVIDLMGWHQFYGLTSENNRGCT